VKNSDYFPDPLDVCSDGTTKEYIGAFFSFFFLKQNTQETDIGFLVAVLFLFVFFLTIFAVSVGVFYPFFFIFRFCF